MKGTLGSRWGGGQRPDGNGLSTLARDKELSPGGDGHLEEDISVIRCMCYRNHCGRVCVGGG